MPHLTIAQQKKLVKELRKASALHKGQADLIERSMKGMQQKSSKQRKKK
tara:strand:+ start:32 stop:178 length:147 start_codon:yes stop_codon:yes gene_type:complete